MSVNALNTSVSGMRANQFRLDAAANNIANVNTDGFRARTVQATDSAYINGVGQGTRIAATYQDMRSGAPAPVSGGGSLATGGGGGTSVEGMAMAEPVAQSDTDMAREMTGLDAARTAYSMNAAMGRTVDEMTQTLLDVKA